MFNYIHALTDESWHRKLFIYSYYGMYMLYAITFTGIIYVAPEFLVYLRTFVVYYVCGFIMIRFNPFVPPKSLNKMDNAFERRVVFSSAIFLLLTTCLTDLSLAFIDRYVHAIYL